VLKKQIFLEKVLVKIGLEKFLSNRTIHKLDIKSINNFKSYKVFNNNYLKVSIVYLKKK